MTNAATIVATAWAAGLAPEPALTVSEWADKHRVLPPQSAEPGRWRTDRVPYIRGVQDALSVSSPYERVVFVKSAQIGGTEAALNFLGYAMHHAPATTLLVWPSQEMVKRNVTARIDPMIEHCPALRELVVEKKSREAGNTMQRKTFPGGELHLVGAQSAIGLRSLPARFVLLDEVDAFPADCDGEGDPVALAIARTATFRGRRKIFLCSTPTIAGFSRIERAYDESDRRVYECPCPHCGDYAEILWPDIRWPEGRPQDAYWACPSCGAVVDERYKHQMVSTGRWRATSSGDGKTAGFRVNALISPFASWGELAIEFVTVRKDASRLKTFVNTVLGQPWEDARGEGIDATGLAARREHWEGLPPGVVVITAGVDVQADRIEVTVVGWGAGEESWVLEHTILWGDPTGPQVWADLDSCLSRTWEHPTLDVPPLPIRAVCVDSGYQSAIVTGWCRGKEGRIWATKGSSNPAAPLWPRHQPKKQRGKAPVFLVGSSAGKELIYGRLRNVEPGPGCIHFHASLSDEWFAQLTAEKVRTRYVKGHPVREWWKPDSARNEAIDCVVYAAAALAGLRAMRFDLDKEAAQRMATANPKPKTEVKSVAFREAKPPVTPANPPTTMARSRYLG